MSKTKCTKETIIEEQARLKKEPFMLDDVNKWIYYVTDTEQTKEHKPTHRKPKKRKPKPKSGSKQQDKSI